jgi:hypothetical protein
MKAFTLEVPEEPSNDSVVMDKNDVIWQRRASVWACPGSIMGCNWVFLLQHHGPLTLLHDGGTK